MWDLKKGLTLVIDVSTYCNAKCPQCDRTDKENNLKKKENIPLVNWSIDDIRKHYSREQLLNANVKSITLCPTWGDAMVNPDIFEIINHFLKNLKPHSNIYVYTNGSMRDENFWFKLGGLPYKHKISRSSLHVTFDIDGINQNMHNKYRRNTSLQKALNNMKAFSESGGSKTYSQTILFKHNQDYMQEIRDLVNQYGSQYHEFVKSDRFKRDKEGNYLPLVFNNEKGETETLEWADITFEKPFLYHNVESMTKTIECRWAKTTHLNVNFDGQIWPCCYFGAADHRENYKERFYNFEVIKKYNENRLDNNIRYKPLTEIINNDWFQRHLEDSIRNDPVNECKHKCSINVLEFDKQQVRSV